MNKYYSSIIAVLLLSFLCQCRSKVREQKDELYSRYLQKKIALTIYNTPVPDNKADFNLLLLNDGTAFDKLNLKDLLKTMVQQKDIAPLIIISFHVDSKYYGVVGDGKVIEKNRDAEKFQDFLVKELIPFAKKRAGARKFSSVVMAGYAASAIPVWDAAWDRAATYQKVGIFLPQFETKSDTTLLYKKISPSRKNPKTDYWIWSPDSRNQNNQLTILTDLIDRKVSPVKEINHDTDFRSTFIDFTKWAFGN